MFDLRSLLPRREFLGRCAALPLVGSMFGRVGSLLAAEPSLEELLAKYKEPPADEVAREVERLLKLIPEELRYRPEPVAPEENAWPVWQEAIKACVEEPDDEAYDAACDLFWTEPDAVDPAHRQRIEEFATTNRRCKELTDEGIVRGKFSYSRDANSLELEDMCGLRDLARVKRTVCQLHLADRSAGKAFDEAVSILAMGEITLRHAECIIDYLISTIIIGIGSHAVYRVAMSDVTSKEISLEAIKRLGRVNGTMDVVKRAYRGELRRWFVPVLARIPENAGVAEAVFRRNLPNCNLSDRPSVRQEYVRVVRTSLALLDGHRKPFDKIATLDLYCKLLQEQFLELNKPWALRNRFVSSPLCQETSDWPHEADFDIYVQLGLERDADCPRRTLTTKELIAAKQRLKRVENVLGKLMIRECASNWGSAFEMNLVRREACRLRIALRLYHQQQSRMAARLDDLVTEKLLPSVPIDPYDGQPFRYSVERRVIWSVGEDGKNTGEIPEQDDPNAPFDEDYHMTWRIAAAG